MDIFSALWVNAVWALIMLNLSFMIFSDFYSVKSIPILMFSINPDVVHLSFNNR